MFKKMVFILLIFSAAAADPAEELNILAQDYIDYRAEFYPVWATAAGIYDYDSLLTDYSANGIYKYRNDLAIINQKLEEIDTTQLGIDDYINYRLLKSNLAYDEFQLTGFPLYALSAALYIEEPIYGIYYLLEDNSRTMEEKAPFILSRMGKIHDFINLRWPYQQGFAPVFYGAAIGMIDGSMELINEAAEILLEVMPDSSRRIVRARQNALADLRSYRTYCEIEQDDVSGTHVIGKDKLNYLLKNIFFVEMDSDSLKKIGWKWYNICTAAIDSIQKKIDKNNKAEKEISIIPNLTREDIINYYQREIDEVAKFLRDNDIITIPDNIGACIPVETPEFMRAFRKGIAYKPPPPFSSDQTGYFYVRPIEKLTTEAIYKYSAQIQTRGFKGSVVHEAYPGHHLQLSISNRHPHPLRKIQDNRMMVEGWALYCEQMATEQGFFDEDDIDQRWLGVYGGIRFRAVRVIVDCSLADGSMSPDSALTFMNNMLGENTDYFTAEIRRYCANPMQALSYLTGKLMILKMLEIARQKEGNSFSLKDFHNKLLAEGSIPPPLIAEKLGYK